MANSFVAGDTDSIFRPTLKDQDGSVIDCSGATVVTMVWSVGTYMDSAIMADSDAANGVMQHKFTASQLRAGIMSIEVIIDDGDGVVTNLDLGEYTVRTRLRDY